MREDRQFCIPWDDHLNTLVQVINNLLSSNVFVDCTLAAEGQYLHAHKIILSACSPFLEALLTQHYEKHPIIVLKDVKFEELKLMMDYMYKGKVDVSFDRLSQFLNAASSLHLRGLSEDECGSENEVDLTLQETDEEPSLSIMPITISSKETHHELPLAPIIPTTDSTGSGEITHELPTAADSVLSISNLSDETNKEPGGPLIPPEKAHPIVLLRRVSDAVIESVKQNGLPPDSNESQSNSLNKSGMGKSRLSTRKRRRMRPKRLDDDDPTATSNCRRSSKCNAPDRQQINRMTPYQLRMLNKVYKESPNLEKNKAAILARKTGLKLQQVIKWFQNHHNRAISQKNGAPKRLTPYQREILKKAYTESSYVTPREVKILAQRIGEDETRVKRWFSIYDKKMMKQSKQQIDDDSNDAVEDIPVYKKRLLVRFGYGESSKSKPDDTDMEDYELVEEEVVELR